MAEWGQDYCGNLAYFGKLAGVVFGVGVELRAGRISQTPPKVRHGGMGPGLLR